MALERETMQSQVTGGEEALAEKIEKYIDAAIEMYNHLEGPGSEKGIWVTIKRHPGDRVAKIVQVRFQATGWRVCLQEQKISIALESDGGGSSSVVDSVQDGDKEPSF